MDINTFSTPILAKKNLTGQMLQIRFGRPVDFKYDAGQFVQLFVPNPAGGETPRSYSLSSTPADDYLEFGVKLYDNGLASNYLQKAVVGDQVILKGPLGRFTNTVSGSITGIATGAGLVPIMSIVSDELLNKKNKAAIQVLFGVRITTNLFWVDRLEHLQKEFSNFSYTITLSQSEASWTGARGRVIEHLSGLDSKAQFFLCGSTEMVRDVRAKLLTNQVNLANIHLEIF